jgi:Domain of unknown function (DUF4124)
MKFSKLLVVVGVLFASYALAEIYMWVDEDGITHYEDCPPTDCIFEELKLPEGPTEQEFLAAEEEMRKILEARKARETAAKAKMESEAQEEQIQQQLRAERVKKCSEAIYQLELLNQKRRVFKLQTDGSRLYLENEDRPGEVSRIATLRDQFCSDNSSDQEEQMELAHELGLALSRRCMATRETLEKMQQPGANPIEDKLERYTEYVKAFCPAIGSDDLWLGDWIIIRKERR